jgi:tRNA nucleotidyltransferase (CCA-adding enzyme)
MQVYLVGGAVRDELLGLPVHERDWVVVGATAAEMERAGFRSVGKEFPVFLHPQTHEEYALARQERKTGPGYRGFVVQFSADVTLEQDLQRRDLTINAIACDANGTLIDPYGGARDLKLRVLRHVSPAFIEDPVRILRVARFAARFAELGFKIAPETEQLMRGMVGSGEIDALVPERVWRELERALGEANPEVFFETLERCTALHSLLPELPWTELERSSLLRSVGITPERTVRFAALLADQTLPVVAALCERLRAPAEFRDLAQLSARFARGLNAEPPQPAQLLQIFERSDAFRRPERFEKLLLVAQSLGDVDGTVRKALAAARSAMLPQEQRSGLQGPEIAVALRAARLQQITAILQ